MDRNEMKTLLKAQQGELDAVLMYNALADKVRDAQDAETFRRLAAEEGRHAAVFRNLTGRTLRPKKTLAVLVPVLYRLIGRKRLYILCSALSPRPHHGPDAVTLKIAVVFLSRHLAEERHARVLPHRTLVLSRHRPHLFALHMVSEEQPILVVIYFHRYFRLLRKRLGPIDILYSQFHLFWGLSSFIYLDG